jgi:hypothetical protein
MAAFAAQVRAKLENEISPMQSYKYVETRREVRYDSDGRATSEKVEVFESYPGLPGKSRWLRKISENKSFRRVKGKVWVSESEYEIVRAEGELIETISIGAGLLARLHEGTTVLFQRRKVNGEAWLPARLDVKGSVRLLLLKRLRMGSTQEFSGYRKFDVNTGETYGPVKPPPSH